MPRIVDHDQRRREIGAAVLRLIADRGLDAVTVREIAAESGWSTGVLAHYFRGKDEMLAFAYEVSGEAYRARVEGLPSDQGAFAWFAGALAGLLPLDDERFRELLVWYGFIGRVQSSETLVTFPREAYRALEEMFVDVLRVCQERGEIRADLDPTIESRSLIAFCDGIGLQHVFDPERVSRAELRRLLDARLAGLRPPA